MVLGGKDQREVVDPFEAPDRTRQDDDSAEGPSEPLGLEHDDVARCVLDQVVDVAPEDAAVPFDALAAPSHDEEIHRLLADRVQDDLVDLVADLDDGTRVDPQVLAYPSESLKPAGPRFGGLQSNDTRARPRARLRRGAWRTSRAESARLSARGNSTAAHRGPGLTQSRPSGPRAPAAPGNRARSAALPGARR